MTKQTVWTVNTGKTYGLGPLFSIPQVGYTLHSTSGIQLSSLFIRVLLFDYWCSILGLSRHPSAVSSAQRKQTEGSVA